MIFQFYVEGVAASRGKLPREERNDIIQYFENVCVDAEDPMKAYRILSRQSAGRLSKESREDQAVITLPEYGSCQITVRAYTSRQ